MLRITRPRIAAISLIATLALAPGLARAAGWLKPTPLNLAPASNPSVGLDGGGNTIAAWETDPSNGFQSIAGARHVAGAGGFAALADFSDDILHHDNSQPVVATNAAGVGLVAWVEDLHNMGNEQVDVRTVTAGGRVGDTVVPVSASFGAFANVAVAINAGGDAVVAWTHLGSHVEAVTRQGANGTFTSPTTLDTAALDGPKVAIDNNGNSLALWPTNALMGSIFAKRHPAGGTWSTTHDTVATAGHAFTDPSLAANPNGQLVVAFLDVEPPVISEASGSVSGGFGTSPTIKTLSAPGVSGGPGVAVDDGGGAIVAWRASKSVRFSRRPPGGAFPAPTNTQSIAPVPVTPNNLVLAGNGHGEVIAAWYSFESPANHNVVRAAVKPAGATVFGASQVISDQTRDTYDSPMAIDQNGDAVAGLPLGSSGGPLGVEAVVFDATPPRLGTPTGPAAVLQGAKATFSVPTPTDAFSAVTVKWSFGDGSAAVSGVSVSHAYTRAGRFTVKVTATDASGNSASKSLTLTVTTKTRCVVPKLKGKTLAQAKTLLARAHCRLGSVHKPKPSRHHKHPKLVVSKTSPGAGQVRPAGTKVAVTLVRKPKPKP